MRIFDAHLHYNQEPNPFYDLDKVLEIFRRNNVTGIIATSRPNKGTHQLVDAKAPGLTVVPFIRPYRTRSDIQTWFDDPAIWELIQSEYKRGYYRGIGEFHIYGKAAGRRAGQADREFRGGAGPLAACALRRGSAAAPVRSQSEGQDHLGAHRLLNAAGARARTARQVSGPDGRALLSRRHHRGGRQTVGRLARPVREPLAALPAGLRHLDQRALVRLRHDHEGLSRLARAVTRRPGGAHRARQWGEAVSRAASEFSRTRARSQSRATSAPVAPAAHRPPRMPSC